jgi:hypothetical protein
MTNLVVTDLNRDKGRKRADLKQKRVRNAAGKQQTLYVLETQRADVGDQLRTVFQLNVDRARRRRVAAPVAAE